MDLGDERQSHERWQDHNRRGLAFAAAADWAEATDAFAAAAEALANDPEELTPHEALALVLGNLAQACFRDGKIDEALSHAQRACALRVALTGEDGMPAARARMDFAVMLATAGRRDEAMQLVQRAIAAVETHVGEEDPRLTVVLENAARIALSGGAAASAEPFLLRLHALLALHEESTQAADQLLARIAEVRKSQGAAVPNAVPTIPSPVPTPTEVIAVPGDIAVDLVADWEDQPLRDAVALTDVLLRTTPSGVPTIPDPAERATTHVGDTEPEIEFTDFDTPLVAAAPEEPTSSLVLGFAVHHGVLDEEFLTKAPEVLPLELVEETEDSAPPPALAEEIDAVPDQPAPIDPVPMMEVSPTHEAIVLDAETTTPPSAAVEAPSAKDAPDDVLPVMPPRSVSVALPANAEGGITVESRPAGGRRGRAGESSKSPRGGASKPSSSGVPWLPVGGGLAAAAAAAAWWLFLR